jgi:hypothetical protein
MRKLTIFLIIALLLVSSVLAWTFQPSPVVSEPVSEEPLEVPVEVIDIDTGLKEVMPVEKVDALKSEYAVDYAEHTRTVIDTSKIEVLGQSVKSCITFTSVKINGVSMTVISAKGSCQVKLQAVPIDEEPLID